MDFASLVLFEDNHLLAINKPAGMLVQGDRTGDPSLLDYASEYIGRKYHKPGRVFIGLIHRLDRPVSGTILLARTSKALARMNDQFAGKRVKKCYWALTMKRPPRESDVLEHWLKKDPARNRTSAFRRQKAGTKFSRLRYELILSRGKNYLLEIFPETGRSHQIRSQLAAVGCPITGDVKYGFKGSASNAIALHSKSLQFDHPVKKEPLNIEASLPKINYWQAFI